MGTYAVTPEGDEEGWLKPIPKKTAKMPRVNKKNLEKAALPWLGRKSWRGHCYRWTAGRPFLPDLREHASSVH